MLKNVSCLSMSARHIKNRVLRDIIWNVIDPNNIFKLTDLINKVLSIPNIKFANPAIILSNCIKVSSCYNVFSWPIPSINWANALKSISNTLNSILLYWKL